MTNTDETQGSCLCGAVHIVAKNADKKVGACHCEMCRKWAGGPFMGIDCGSAVSFEGKEHISVFDSSEWAERGFCSKCGSHLFYRLKQNDQYIMPIGLFGNAEGIVFDHQVFIDEKPAYYSFADDTKNMTGAELFAQFSTPPEV